jgi:hypothetical protein
MICPGAPNSRASSNPPASDTLGLYWLCPMADAAAD